MGEVYRATDTRLARDVALKVLPEAFAADPERLARFEREAKLLGSLSHSRIAHVYGFERLAGPRGTPAHVLVLELAEGEDLAERLRHGPLPVDEAIAVARQVAEALEEAHARGIVHRDLKPANVRVSRAGQVKVLDFGLAKAWSGDAERGSASAPALSESPTLAPQGTAAGVILGTAPYMSPEQARGRSVDSRADIWSFGVLLYELLTGRRLFAGETVSDVLAAVLRQEPDWAALPAATPASVRRLVARCLERDVRRRLQAIGEARITLEDVANGEELPSGGRPGPRRGARVLPWLIAGVAAALAAWALGARRPSSAAAGQALHVDVAFPGDVEPIGTLDSGFCISPDGRLAAMTGVKGAARRLYLRSLDAGLTKELPDAGVTGAAFSPDSRRIALMMASGGVIVYSLADLQRTVIASGADISGAIGWGEAGIVISRGGALWLVSTEGGEPRPLTTLDAERNELVQRGQHSLPGGRFVLFTSHTEEVGEERIEAVAVENGVRHVVLERATTPVWSPPGHLLFARDGAVLAAPFELATARVQGEPVTVIAPGVVATSNTGSLALRLAGNGTLLYLPQEFHFQRLVSVARDGSALALGLPPGRYTNPRISPDGRRVLVESEGTRLVVLDLARGTHARLAGESLSALFSTWSADGRRVAYRQAGSMAWVSAEGSGEEGHFAGSAANDFPSNAGLDPDSFLVNRIQPDTAGDVMLLSASGAFEPRTLIGTRAYEGGAQLSPDHRWLLYVSNESGQAEVYVRPYPSLDRRFQVSQGGGSQSRWAASGREIYYRGGARLAAVAFDGRAGEPVLGKPVALFEDEYSVGQGITIPNYDVTPDGRFLMLRRDAQGAQARLVLDWTEELKRVLAEGGVK